MSRSGPDLALLLLGGFRTMVDAATSGLAELGYEDVRPAHDFALRAILAGADSASELGRRTDVTKQAAAKTIAVLEERGYVTRAADPLDRRRMHVHVTPRGRAMLAAGERILDEVCRQWEQRVGAQTVTALEAALRDLVGTEGVSLASPGWVATSTDV
ncbi:MarR family winged helix-turn-helix transcriptional regulator [Aeromicrobium wangtongii]|uniref:Winged helix DNA-binding protein n=1 Tax=Aeromicrobium wangtongii TaxID=2969247 RepID=A0ABY5M3X8_9ACTN|nr:MarR family transcriptional regulator [Aeromicrobium wangtongii]MCD9199094.1 winged helix DNA-binding protein [Aeromicrobium wangtongii]UUP12875.1 winged helix DNA-binding protein [Aeromicrobium wangtongii]